MKWAEGACRGRGGRLEPPLCTFRWGADGIWGRARRRRMYGRVECKLLRLINTTPLSQTAAAARCTEAAADNTHRTARVRVLCQLPSLRAV